MDCNVYSLVVRHGCHDVAVELEYQLSILVSSGTSWTEMFIHWLWDVVVMMLQRSISLAYVSVQEPRGLKCLFNGCGMWWS